MRFKARKGDRFIFDGGYDNETLELELKVISNEVISKRVYKFKGGIINESDGHISCLNRSYRDINTAVNLVTILKDEGVIEP